MNLLFCVSVWQVKVLILKQKSFKKILPFVEVQGSLGMQKDTISQTILIRKAGFLKIPKVKLKLKDAPTTSQKHLQLTFNS